MKYKHFNVLIEAMFLILIFLLGVIFDRRIGIVFSLSKATTLRLFTLAILFAWAAKILIFKEHKFVRTILDWPVLTYLLACTAATALSVHPYISFFGFNGRFEGLITLYNFGLLFFIATNYVTDLKAVKRLVATVCSAAAIMSIYSIIQRKGLDPYAWGGVITWQRVIATIGQPNFFAAYADMAFLLILVLFLGRDKDQPYTLRSVLPFFCFLAPIAIFLLIIYNLDTNAVFIWYAGFFACGAFAVLFAYKYDELPQLLKELILGVTLILIYTALFYTQSRGGFLGFFAALSLFFIIGPRRLIVLNWQKLLILILALGLITGVTISDPQFSLFSRMSSEVTFETPDQGKSASKIEFQGAAGSRGETWTSGFKIIADYPVFGIGPEVLKMVFPRYETEMFRFKENFHVKQDRCHNETFDVPVTRGLISFFAYLIVLFLIFRRGLRNISKVPDEKRLILAAFLSAAAAYLIQNQFSFGVIAIVSLFWVIWAVIILAKDLPEEGIDRSDERTARPDEVPWLFIAILAALMIAAGYFSAFQFWADKEAKAGMVFSERRQLDKAGIYFERSLDLMPFEGGPITHGGIALLNQVNTAAPEDREQIRSRAIDLLKYGTLVDPYNADNFFILSKIYFMQGDLSEAEKLAYQALKIDPYYGEVHVVLGLIAERKKDDLSARKHFEEAYRLNPRDIVEAKERRVFYLMNEGKLKDAFELVQAILMENPKNANAYNALGIIYTKIGRTQNAKEAFETALKLDPGNAYAKKALGRR